jgi:outer membrane protein assembly factor BamE (lipoprotein component of BamABCDE complex)
MKNIITLFFVVALYFNANAQGTEPQYTTIDKLSNVNIGMTEDQVTNILGISPYDVYHDVANNCKVLVWYYKHKHHIIPSSQENTKASLSGGKTSYVNSNKVYMNFSENDKKLTSYFTEKGMEKSLDLIKMGRQLNEICNNPDQLKLKNKGNDKIIMRSINHDRYGAFFKLGLDNNPDGNADILLGAQYRRILKPFTNQKSLSFDAKLLYNLTAKDEEPEDYWNDHLIMSIPMYVCYNYRSWSLGAGLHLSIGNEGTGDDEDGQMGEKEGYDNLLSVPVLKIGYNLYDKVNFEYNYDLSSHGQSSIGVGYYWNF